MFYILNVEYEGCESCFGIYFDFRQRASMFCQIAPITEQEFCGVQDYLQRILPLHIINGHIDTLNQVLRNKQGKSK